MLQVRSVEIWPVEIWPVELSATELELEEQHPAAAAKTARVVAPEQTIGQLMLRLADF